MLPLEKSSALHDLQRYVLEMEEERGFTNRGVVQQCLLLGEEVGELLALLLYMWVAGMWYGSFRLAGPQASMTVASAASALRKP